MKAISSSVDIIQTWFNGKTISSIADHSSYTEKGALGALVLFHRAAQRVPAYKKFLRKHGVHHEYVQTQQDLLKVPITTKENYIDEYDVWQRMWDGKPEAAHMISTSSGTAGAPHYWPRSLCHDIDGALVHEFFLRNIFDIKSRQTLFINGFALGNWIAGTFTFQSVSLVSWKGYPLTMMTPGYDSDAILRIIEDVSPFFGQTIIAGHAPFLKTIAETIAQKKFNRRADIKFLGTGQGITEQWREYVTTCVKGVDIHRTVINLYGSADASLMGFETPVTISMRRHIEQQPLLVNELFGSERLPSLYQYDPKLTYFEALQGELCITKDSGAPLIRYNIHDVGGVYSYKLLCQRLDNASVHKQQRLFPWQLPFVYLFGREKFMVKIYGANIYTEHVQRALDNSLLQPFITGRFLLDTIYDQRQNPVLVVRVELNPKRLKSPTIARKIRGIFIDEVCKGNTEYRFVVSTMGDKAKPHIDLFEYGKSQYFPVGVMKKTA